MIEAVMPVGSTSCQVNGPTLVVMSELPLKANAWNSQLSGPAGAPFERHVFERVGGCVGDLLTEMLVTLWWT